MNKNKVLMLSILTLAISLPLAACNNNQSSGGGNGEGSTDNLIFHYQDIEFENEYGNKTNGEKHDYSSLIVNKTTNELREDFAFGVDASMTYDVERYGGVYYNERGQQQDIFQILRNDGVNFVRFRLWNNPKNILRQAYGGGNNSVDVDLQLARRAKEANLNVMIDFHYSDFWADPDQQRAPVAWASHNHTQMMQDIKDFTIESLNKFKNEGITVDAVQIGNETNNGLCGYKIDWANIKTSFDNMADLFKAGIEGAKSVFPNIKTMIHLANGGNTEEFKTYFSNLDARGVNYDLIGASYYPHLSGSLDELQENLNTISAQTGKPVIVAETSWGFTDDSVDNITGNTYNKKDEDVGLFLTSTQGQATALRDICDVLSKVPNQKGLGIFYWEPGWLPVGKEVDGKTVCAVPWATAAGQSYQYTGSHEYRENYEDGLATWCNQGLFSYSGKALPSLRTFSFIRNGYNEVEEITANQRDKTLNVTINLAANEKLPEVAKVETNLDAIRYRPVIWEEDAVLAAASKGQHDGLVGTLDGTYTIKCNAKCIQNFVNDPGFENQGTTDTVKEPWIINYSTPANDKVIKIDRKKDIRSGKSDLNWYHSSQTFGFEVYQEITLQPGRYKLTTYIMGVEFNKIKHNKLELFYTLNGGEKTILDMCNSTYLAGWTAGYKECVLDDIIITEADTKIRIGLTGEAEKEAWAHNDDWELVRYDD